MLVLLLALVLVKLVGFLSVPIGLVQPMPYYLILKNVHGYEQISNQRLTRGDDFINEFDTIIYPPLPDKFHGKEQRVKRTGLRSQRYRWPRNTVPFYMIPGNFSNEEKNVIYAAMKEWSNYTCIVFKRLPRPIGNFLFIINVGRCFSFVGNVGSRGQIMTLGPWCKTKWIVTHELGHALGLTHEHNRPDRDSYVSIHSENLLYPELAGTFNKNTLKQVSYYGIPYDYYSIMHYSNTAGSKDVNKYRTIVATDPKYDMVIGRQKGVSFLDIQIINTMYKCSGHCKNVTCSKGFADESCNCVCRGIGRGVPTILCIDKENKTLNCN